MSSNTSKYYGENGIHRVPLWRIGGFALNNTATNLYLFLMNYVAYYLGGVCRRSDRDRVKLFHDDAYLGRRDGSVHRIRG